MKQRRLRQLAKNLGTFLTGITFGGFALGCGDSPVSPEKGSRFYILEQGKSVAMGLEGIGNYFFTLKKTYPSGQGRPLAEIEVQAKRRTKTLSFDPFYKSKEGFEGLEGDVSHLPLASGDFLDRGYWRGAASRPSADMVVEEIQGAETPSLEDDAVRVRVDVNKYLR